MFHQRYSRCPLASSVPQVQLGSIDNGAAHAVAIAKSQAAAEQSAALGERAVELAAHARTVQEHAELISGESALCLQLLEQLQRASDQELHAQQTLVQAADLFLCEAMSAALRGDRGAGVGLGASDRQDSEPQESWKSDPVGDFDCLFETGHPMGTCLSAARVKARRGEDMAQEAARAVQSAKEQMEQQMEPFARHMKEAADSMDTIASAWSAQCESLRAQVSAIRVYDCYVKGCWVGSCTSTDHSGLSPTCNPYIDAVGSSGTVMRVPRSRQNECTAGRL